MDDAKRAMYERQLIALGALLALPKRVETIKASDFGDGEIASAVEWLKRWKTDGKPRIEAWFASRGVPVNGGIVESLLETVAVDARHQRAMRFVTDMALGGRMMDKQEWLKLMREQAWE